jgi:hypothetical protein
LIRIEKDRRLGHEWEEWDGSPLPNGGNFTTPAYRYFIFAALALLALPIVLAAAVFLLEPRIAQIAAWLPAILYWSLLVGGVASLVWLALIAVSYATGRALLPEFLAERGIMLRTMNIAWRMGELFGVSRDRTQNATVAVYERLALARQRRVNAGELLILIPRCLSRSALDGVLEIAKRHNVAAFVATRGQLARRVIRERRPKAVVAVACERDMVSGLHDVAGRVPVLGLTMQLPAGPCKDAVIDLEKLEAFVGSYVGDAARRGVKQP